MDGEDRTKQGAGVETTEDTKNTEKYIILFFLISVFLVSFAVNLEKVFPTTNADRVPLHRTIPQSHHAAPKRRQFG